jgi:hypothetical protein
MSWLSNSCGLLGLAVQLGWAQDQSGSEAARWADLARRAPIRPALVKDAVETTLQKRAPAVAGRLRHPVSPYEVEAMKARVRQQLRDSLGTSKLLSPPDLRATVLGTTREKGYAIEKVAYQTLPDLLVTADIYNSRSPL